MVECPEARPLPVHLIGLPLAIVLCLAAAIGAVWFSQHLFIGVLALLGCGAAALIVARIETATPLFMFAMYVNLPVVAKRFHGLPAPLAAASIGLLLLPLAYYVIVKGQRILVSRAFPFLVLWFAVQLTATLFADHKDAAAAALFVSLSEGVVLYALVYNVVRSQDMLREVTWALIAAGVFMGGLGLVQKASDTYWRDYKGFAQVSEPDRNAFGEIVGGRWPSGAVGEKNYYAQFMLMLVPLALSRHRGEQRWWLQAAGLLSAGVILGGMALTASRGAAIGLAAVLIAMVVLRCLTPRQLFLTVIAASTLVLVFPTYRERLLSIGRLVEAVGGERSVRETDTAAQGRLTEMMAALLVFRDHPVLGAGPGNFPYHFTEKAGSLGFQIHSVERLAHCAYLEIAAETGMLGLACYFAILGITTVDLLRARREAADPDLRAMIDGFLLSLAAMTTTALFLSFAYVRYYWLVLALSAAASRIAAERCAENRASRAAAIAET